MESLYNLTSVFLYFFPRNDNICREAGGHTPRAFCLKIQDHAEQVLSYGLYAAILMIFIFSTRLPNILGLWWYLSHFLKQLFIKMSGFEQQ